MTVAATQERMEAAMALLRRRAAQGLGAPTNIEIAKACGLGRQRYQPWDRTMTVGKKPEAGAVIIAALEYCGLISVERGRNWRRITILQTGQVLERQKPRMAA